MNRFTNLRVPFYVVILVMLPVVAVSFFGALYFHRAVQDYAFFLPEKVGAKEGFNYGSWPALTNGDFFRSVRDKLVGEKASFIEADLAAKQLTVFEDGKPALNVPILAIGRAGSWWETPAGLYKIASKEKTHFSAFSGVNMPWSLPFQGNFFIHGWPYYPDGTPVATSYSGGCIRLSTDDAKKVYDLASTGMPVLVFRGEALPDATRYTITPPAVSASRYLVADLGSNFVLAEKGAKDVVPIASITKLVTALVATEYINLDNKITITKSMLVPTSKPRLWVGQNVRAFDLMYPLLLESSNEVAEAFAQTLGRDRFIGLMNDKVRALGLTNTHLVDPAGVEPGNVSTAEDLFALLKYLYTNQSFFLKVAGGHATKELGPAPVFSGLENFNGFVGSPEFFGGKIGKSEAAQETYASIFEMQTAVQRPVAIVVLGSENSIQDTAVLLDYVRATYTPAP